MNLFSDSVANGVIILDFGSQYTQLIARRLRELNVYSQILPYDTSLEKLKGLSPKGIILSGGPHSVYDDKAPKRELSELMDLAPLMGVCYGMQLLCHQLGGQVEKAELKEYGLAQVDWKKPVAGLSKQSVWMSHGDVLVEPPEGVQVHAYSENGHPAVVSGDGFFAVQFHPEVVHTEQGTELLKYFIFDQAKVESNWSSDQIFSRIEKKVKQVVKPDDHVLCALSGGVDSMVVAVLLNRILGKDKVHCVFVDTGLLRKNEFQEVQNSIKQFGLDLTAVDASTEFLSALDGVSDPEKKRKIIGHKFIDVFKNEMKNFDRIDWLAQGTLYPDVIESVSPNGQSVTIKSHHNVGGLPDNLDLQLLEPVRELFKDEVRELGKYLEISSELLNRHPFPGPGLAIRVLGAIDPDSLNTLRDADYIYVDALKSENLYDKIWQAFSVLLPVRTVGVQGDGRTYEKVLSLRAVTSVDGMTADWFEFEPAFLKRVSNKITNSVPGVNRVVYDITSKPPGTIEWE